MPSCFVHALKYKKNVICPPGFELGKFLLAIKASIVFWVTKADHIDVKLPFNLSDY